MNKNRYNTYMTPSSLAPSAYHELTEDIEKTLKSSPDATEAWNALTPLARNEWICWITHVQKESTRKEHVERMYRELLDGKKRPCCWPGCPHRRPKAQKWFSKNNL